jgi:RNA polymerase sigma-70 factor (ECF subfamily)
VIEEALVRTPWQTGFRSGTALDDSPETMSKTRYAVARAKRGDQEAVRFLYVSYSDNVYGYVRSIVHDDHEAEDITQHVFAKVMTTLVRYDERGVPFFAWLLRMARNAAIDHLRASRTTPMEAVLDPDAISAADLGQVATLRVALAALPDKQREVVILHHLAGYTPEEIADRMGRTKRSVHGLHHRGRRALRRELERLESSPSVHSRPAALVAA